MTEWEEKVSWALSMLDDCAFDMEETIEEMKSIQHDIERYTTDLKQLITDKNPAIPF
jgi:phage-related protein